MSRDGNGNYSLPAGNPVVNGTTITDTWANTTLNDIASALTQSIAKDGQTVPSANLPMGGYKFTGLADGAANGQALVYGQTTAAVLGGSLAVNGNTTLGDASTDTLNVGNGGLVKDANNNFGLSVTPSSWGAIFRAVQVANNGFALTGRTDTQQGNMSVNWYFDGTNNKYIANGFASKYSQDNGLHFWQVAPNGTAGANLTFTTYLTLDGVGRLYGSALHNNSSGLAGTTNQYIGSGTYTPTLFNTTNVSSSTAYPAQWIRVGNVVTVSGQVDITPTSASASTVLGISIPIGSTLSAVGSLAGTACSFVSSTANLAGRVIQDTTNNRALVSYINSTSTSSTNWSYHFTYVVQ